MEITLYDNVRQILPNKNPLWLDKKNFKILMMMMMMTTIMNMNMILMMVMVMVRTDVRWKEMFI